MNSNEEENEPKSENEQLTNDGRGRRGFRGRGRWLFRLPFILAFLAAKAGAVFYLWNALIPELFHGPEVSLLQALGLIVLAKLLVGGFGGRGFGGHGFGGGHRHWHGRHGRGRGHHSREHWMNLSDEDRQKLREEFRRR